MNHEQIRCPVALVFAVETRRLGAVGKAVRISFVCRLVASFMHTKTSSSPDFR